MPSTIQRLDANDPKDVQLLVDSGLAWRSGPKTLQGIFRLIADGKVKRNPAKETPEVKAYLDKVAPVADEAEATAEPVEPTSDEPVEPPVADRA